MDLCVLLIIIFLLLAVAVVCGAFCVARRASHEASIPRSRPKFPLAWDPSAEASPELEVPSVSTSQLAREMERTQTCGLFGFDQLTQTSIEGNKTWIDPVERSPLFFPWT